MSRIAKPSDIRKSVSKIALDLEACENPSRRDLALNLGRVLLAFDDALPTAVESPAEGVLAAPPGEVLSLLQKWLTAKYAIDAAYRSFADRVRGLWRDSLVDHWHEHSKEERGHAYDIAMRVVGMGGDPAQTVIQVPACTPNLEGFFRTLASMELEAIGVGRQAITMAGSHTSLQVMAENFVLVDTQHLDDLRRMQARFDIPT